jgi:sensor histidine kinase regulating citrate/malate metabolism
VPTGLRRGAPRVGDGVRLDVEGIVTYASPNAISALHRLGHHGDLVRGVLSEVVTRLLRDPSQVDEALAVVVTGRAPWRTEVESRFATLSLRAIPLTEGGARIGAVVLVRDVSELRRRERELMTKDATIREIHHRVKNNLQTVAALLRLQSRRVADEQAKAALREAERRVATIALVHETLSRTPRRGRRLRRDRRQSGSTPSWRSPTTMTTSPGGAAGASASSAPRTPPPWR